MKRKLIALFVFGFVLPSLPGRAADPDKEPEKPNEESNRTAVLTVRERTMPAQGQNGEYHQADIVIDTGTIQYRLKYKSYPGDAAQNNREALNDGRSGYGMVGPSECWYANGMVNAITRSRSGSLDTSGIEGKVKVLEETGTRVGYDLIFDSGDRRIVMRTMALAGRDELFVKVCGDENMPLVVSWDGYPCGYEEPRQRCVIMERGEVERSDANSPAKTAPIDLNGAPWMLLSDLVLNKDGNAAHQLGLVFEKANVETASVTIGGNYVVEPTFKTSPGSDGIKFIIRDFDPMSVKDAANSLTALAKDSDALWKKAFEGLPSP